MFAKALTLRTQMDTRLLHNDLTVFLLPQRIKNLFPSMPCIKFQHHSSQRQTCENYFLNGLFESIYATSMMVRVHNVIILSFIPELNLGLPCSKTNLLKPGGGEEKYSVYYRHKAKSMWVAYAQKTELPESFQGKVFKGSIWGEGCLVHDFLLTG